MSTADNDIRDHLGIGPRPEEPSKVLTEKEIARCTVLMGHADSMARLHETAYGDSPYPTGSMGWMSPKTVERVAKALAARDGHHPDDSDAVTQSKGEFRWHEYIPAAEVAIAAMRDGDPSKNAENLNTSGGRAQGLNARGISFDKLDDSLNNTIGSMPEGVAEIISQRGEALFRVVGKEDSWILALYVHPPARGMVARPASEWHEDIGPVLWWNFPIEEPPYCGTPLDDVFPRMSGEPYKTHWTPIETPKHHIEGK